MTQLSEQIETARRRVVSDGYDMSVGELISLYRDRELVINPIYQRYFRWTDSQKTRFIESLLLGIPTPPIFVFQQAGGVWELIDGLQRISTVLEFVGELRRDGEVVEPSSLEGTNLVPSLAEVAWESLPMPQRLDIRRSRMRVEILKKESDEEAKFELFQRLNTGGTHLTDQEVRNCVLVMVNQEFHDWLRRLTESDCYSTTVVLSDVKKQQQQDMEIALRYVAYRHVPYVTGLDVNEYLDRAALTLAREMTSDRRAAEETAFFKTFELLRSALSDGAFKKWDGQRHVGAFSVSGFDAIAHGVASNLEQIIAIPDAASWVREKARAVWQEQKFQKNSGQGVRGTTRLKHLLPFGETYFRP